MPRGGRRTGAGRPCKDRPKKSKPAPVQTCAEEPTSAPRITHKQARYIDGLAQGKTKKQAALAAGYAPSVARNPRQMIEGPGVREEFKKIIVTWVDPELIGQRIAEGLSATETRLFQHKGVVTDSCQLVDWDARARYIRLAADFCGYHVPKQEVEQNVNPEFADKTDAELEFFIQHGRWPSDSAPV